MPEHRISVELEYYMESSLSNRYILLWVYLCVMSIHLFIYLFGVLCHFQHCTGHITMGSWKGRGNQYIEFIRVLYCKLPTKGKQLPAFPLEAMPGTKPQPQKWGAGVLPLCQCGPVMLIQTYKLKNGCNMQPSYGTCYQKSCNILHPLQLARFTFRET